MVRKEHFDNEESATENPVEEKRTEPKKLSEMSDAELKAFAYDCIVQSQEANRTLAVINDELNLRQKKY